MFEKETYRLRLRQFTPDDLDEVARIFANPDVTRFLGVAGEPLSRAESEKALLGIIAHWKQHGFGRWAVVYKETGKLIGYGGIRSFGQNAELVYLLDKPYWGQGLATELANACLKFGFEERNFDQIIALTKPDNLASRRVLEKIGMHYQGKDGFFRLMAEVEMKPLNDDICQDIDVVQYSIRRTQYRSNASGDVALLESALGPITFAEDMALFT